MKTQPCMQLTVLQTNLLQVESANVNLCVNWSNLVDLLNICLWNNIPNLCEVVWEILPCKQRFLSCMAFSVYEIVWVAWLSCSWLLTCKQTSACRLVVKFFCYHDLQSLRIYMWKLTWNPMWSVCENNVSISSMWNSRCFAIQWGLNTCESPCESPCEVYENMCEFKWGFTCESLCETPCEVYVKICVKGMTSLHSLFTHISLCKISHACEICVKTVWKTCEKSVKVGHFSHVFHMAFHIHTPSSDKPHYYLSFYLCFPGK